MTTDFTPLLDNSVSKPPVPNLSEAFLTIWLHPRKTIRRIIETNPTYGVIPIILISGLISGIFGGLQLPNPQFLSVLAFAIVSLVFAIPFLYLDGLVYRLASRIFDGDATSLQLRAVIAWVSIPATFIQIFGGLSPLLGNSFSIVLSVLTLVFMIWTFYINLNCLSEVNHFSTGGSFLTSIIGGVMLYIPIMIISDIIATLFH